VRQPLAAGAVLGLMSLVKVHALFLLPALCLFLLYASWLHAAGWRAGLLPMAVAAAALFAVRFGLGYALAGKAALSLFGPFYGDAAGSAAGHTLPALLAAAWVSARGHLMALALLAALPLALLAQALAGLFGGDRAARPTPLQAWTLLTLAAAAGMTVLYTASLAGAGTEGLRLHLRYYSFVFPLLWMVAAAAPARPAALRARALRWAAALLVALLLAGALVKLPGYAPNLVDGPELFPLRLDTAPGLALVALELLVLLLWAMGSRAARQLFLLAAVPATIAGGIAGNSAYLAQQRMPLDADKGGKFARAVVPVSERGRITVAGSDPQHLLRAQFHIDDKDSVLLMLPDGAPIAPYQLPVRNKWLLVLGKHALPPGLAPLAQTPDYVLARVGGAHRTIGRAALSAPFGSGLIASTEGLSHAESWGRWSDAKRVVIHFNAPLPRHLNVILTAQAFADNAALPFTMHVGDAAASFRVSGAAQELGLHFDTDGSARSLAIDVPHPVSPAELGQPNDARTLGIGIIDIEIGEGTAAPRSWRAGLPR
jgi:phosphoglycerol transferase